MWVLMEEIYSVNDNGEIGPMFRATPIECSESFDTMCIAMMAYADELGTQGYSAEPTTIDRYVRLRSNSYVKDLYVRKTMYG